MSKFIRLSSPATREAWDIPVLHEDAQLLALAKPAGLLTSPDRYDPHRPDLMQLLHRDIADGAPWAQQRQITFLANAHALDLETTGVLLLAKDQPAFVALANQFSCGQVRQTYVALVHGAPAEDQFKIGGRLAPHPERDGLVRVEEKFGKPALTHCEVLERFSGYTLLKCLTETDRLHQIRVHLQNRGLPIVGDATYGGQQLLLSRLKPRYLLKPGRTERPLVGTLALHAEQLQVTQPATGAPITFTAEWPNDLHVAIKYLRRYAPAVPTVAAPPAA